jgi:hypothetical protein
MLLTPQVRTLEDVNLVCKILVDYSCPHPTSIYQEKILRVTDQPPEEIILIVTDHPLEEIYLHQTRKQCMLVTQVYIGQMIVEASQPFFV